MKVSFEGIGQWCATFAGADVAEGSLVKISGPGTVAACGAGDAFCGVAVCGGGDACTVQLGGFATVPYSGTTAPGVGLAVLAGDGAGGVKTATSGVSCWVVDKDETAKTVTILL